MKIILSLVVSILTLTACGTTNNQSEVMRNFISNKNCFSAEAYANKNYRDEYLSWMLGNVALECWNNRKLAIEHYTAGARVNSKYSYLSINALASMGEKSPVSQQEIDLQQCFTQARRQEQSCALTAYGGVSSIGNPIVRERQQICTDRRMSAEEHCLRMHKPSALQGVPARVPIQQPAQPQQIIIQKQTPLPVVPNTGPIIPGPTPYGR